MKKALYISLLMVMSAFGRLQAQTDNTGIGISGQRVEKHGETVKVSFRADIGRKAAKSGFTVIFTPSLTDGTYEWALPAIIVQGRRAAISEMRHDRAAGSPPMRERLDENTVFTKNGSAVNYEATIDWQLWMDGADLVAEKYMIGCCGDKKLDDILIYRNMSLPPTVKEPAVIDIEKESPILPKVTTGQKLAESLPFIKPASEFEHIEPGELFDEDRENTLTVYFRTGKYEIDESYGKNKQSLIDLMSSIRIIENSIDSRVKTIIIAGFSSPEGSLESNERLARERASSVRRYITDHSELPASAVVLYNGSADWRGLRLLVENSDMDNKERIIEIIDTVPVWDPVKQVGRLGTLMRLDGGGPYLYMRDNFFPKLRNAAYIKIYFEEK